MKVVIPEASPALVSGLAMLGINLVGYTAMAGAIGGGGLGNLAYMYGFARRNPAILYTATIIIVAQRIGTILNADKIVVLDKGKTVGIGRHEELMENCDIYRETANAQMEIEEKAMSEGGNAQ